jgi:hypothetical protein
MDSRLTPLQHNVPITNADGTPTPYFIQLLQQWRDEKKETDELAEGAVQASRTLTAGVGLSGGGTLAADRTFDLEDTAVTPGVYGDALNYPVFTVDQQGRLTNAAEIPLPAGGGGADFLAFKIFEGSPTGAATINVNSTAHIDVGSMAFSLDLTEFPFTEFLIAVSGGSNQAGQTITAQLTALFNPSAPIHTGGNDLVIPNAFNGYSSGWRSKDTGASSGLVHYGISLKGSNSTVDLLINAMTIMLRK